MMIDVEWLIPNRVFVVALRGPVSLAQLQDALGHAQAVLSQAAVTPIHCILDLTQSTRDESDIPDIKQAVDALRKLQPPPPLAGWVVIADPMPNQIVKSIGATATQVIRLRTRFITSVEDGLAFLKQVDTTLTEQSTSA